LREGQADWVAASICGDPDTTREVQGRYRLQEAELPDEFRPYVIGQAAIRTLEAAHGMEGVWSALSAPTVAQGDVEALARGEWRAGWPPPYLGTALPFDAAFGAPRVEQRSAWATMLEYVDEYRRAEVVRGGPGVVYQWAGPDLEEAAVHVLLFDDAEAAARAMAARRVSLGRRRVAFLLSVGGLYSSLSVRPLAPPARPSAAEDGFAAKAYASLGAAYHERWIRVGGELRGVATRGKAANRALKAALSALAALPPVAAPLGVAEPQAAAALAHLAGLPAAPRTLHRDGVLTRLVAPDGRVCSDALRGWASKVQPADRPRLLEFAGCPDPAGG
jgi:hypothetical protein